MAEELVGVIGGTGLGDALAEQIAVTDPHRADEVFRMIDGAIAEARAAGDEFQVARGLSTRAFLATLLRSREEAIEAYLVVLDELERIRQRQPEESVRARVHSRMSFPYYRLSGFLLRTRIASADPDRDVELAFRTIERLRARTMLDVLDEATAASTEERPLPRERTALYERIAEVQKRLLDRDLSPPSFYDAPHSPRVPHQRFRDPSIPSRRFNNRDELPLRRNMRKYAPRCVAQLSSLQKAGTRTAWGS